MQEMQVYTDPDQTPEKPPIFKKGFPVVILMLVSAIVAVTMVQFSASRQVQDWMLAAGAIAGGPGADTLARPLGDFAPYLLHTFLHGGAFHLVMNMAMLIALGPIIVLGLGNTARGSVLFLLFFFVCAAGGAAAEVVWGVISARPSLAIGASSAISGLLPAVGFLRGGWRSAGSMALPWLLINIALAFLGGDVGIMRLAWAAHIGGLLAGFSFPLFLSLARPAR